MPPDEVEKPPILEYAGPALDEPRRWWVFAVLTIGLFLVECGCNPILYPPGRPTDYDRGTMLLIPVGAFILATMTSIPGWAAGMYGLIGASFFVLTESTGRGGGRMLPFFYSDNTIEYLTNWALFVAGSWLVCRVAILLRRFGR